jgi:hypothetical protein
VGDDLYGGPRHRAVRDPRLRAALTPSHTLLHAWRLAVPAWDGGAPLSLEAPPPRAIRAALVALGIDG